MCDDATITKPRISCKYAVVSGLSRSKPVLFDFSLVVFDEPNGDENTLAGVPCRAHCFSLSARMALSITFHGK